MNRNSFLKACFTAGTFLSAPFAALSKFNSQKGVDKGIKVNSGKDRFGKPISLFEGDRFYTKISSQDTDGQFFLFESTREKEGGPPLHLHYDQDEFWYILKGEFIIKVGEETFTVKAGDTVFGPRNIPHTFAKTGKGEARLLIGFQPAGKMEAFFKKISEGVRKNMSEEEMNQFRHEHGMKNVGPSIKYMKKWK